MTANVKFPSKGMRTRVFLPLFLAILLAFYALGVSIFGAPIEVVQRTVTNTTTFWLEFLVKSALVAAIALGHSWFVFAGILNTPLRRLRARFEKSHNDSHAYLLVGILATATVALVGASGANLTQYLYMIATRGALGYFAGTLLTALVARLFGVVNMDQFRDWIDAEDNDSYAILIAGIQVLAMILAMSV